jgi:hypothetical protein
MNVVRESAVAGYETGVLFSRDRLPDTKQRQPTTTWFRSTPMGLTSTSMTSP